ncbi:hypothetical protein BW261_21775 [Klebsiella aerogenes]|uniref:hypothetical protein n=1 Tax=Klebsiella aerogenes TaxID=548 RepID=UPI0009812013|nr:hypothetical protein [Klebsiella aerogenes]OQR43076.1 hypothetical protein BW261_21775 [Klebsiella aerogenes]
MALARNVVFEESVELGFNNRNKKVRVSKKLKPLAIIKLSEPSPPLTPEEQETINSIDGVTWKPRQKYIGFKFSREPLKFECLFDNINEYDGWLEFNRLENENFTGNDLGLYFDAPGITD